MAYRFYTCADAKHCGRSFLALEGVPVSCPYCGEMANAG